MFEMFEFSAEIIEGFFWASSALGYLIGGLSYVLSVVAALFVFCYAMTWVVSLILYIYDLLFDKDKDGDGDRR